MMLMMLMMMMMMLMMLIMLLMMMIYDIVPVLRGEMRCIKTHKTAWNKVLGSSLSGATANIYTL